MTTFHDGFPSFKEPAIGPPVEVAVVVTVVVAEMTDKDDDVVETVGPTEVDSNGADVSDDITVEYKPPLDVVILEDVIEAIPEALETTEDEFVKVKEEITSKVDPDEDESNICVEESSEGTVALDERTDDVDSKDEEDSTSSEPCTV